MADPLLELLAKTCTKCGEAKALDDFPKDATRPGGRHPWCRTCSLASSAKWRRDNRARHLANRRTKDAAQPERVIFASMVDRCTNAKNGRFFDYGGRGITVCTRWLDSFDRFLADMGPRPSPTHSIDRIDNSKGYDPGNCRWATPKEQNRNRRDNRRLTVDGVTKCVAEWAEETGLLPSTICARIDNCGWSETRAVRTPAGAPFGNPRRA